MFLNLNYIIVSVCALPYYNENFKAVQTMMEWLKRVFVDHSQYKVAIS